ncbi:metal-dependent hydrolase, beta-lactamase superfamily [Geotalea daltonii FRC-32]|uniref:Metal-dependent hydrolase, beta-lactamase superfamily n=1 Tax=Geotalea daltonii (strain DSM 22248 / JCM 15807 / FRC-32) TaxID=316067 RepID=B9M2C1_GEODF|nr:MBL fold metallo-hydrolase [Geotalea daltonii]ACM21239.1 metal-dependent hydrolase, beta-lactamase superfamily [Geotalea daltonii FRC-32]
MRACLLASGSKGNSLFIENGETKLLLDAGLSAVEILRRLHAIGVEGSEINAIMISHEHQDHIRGAGALARKLKIPVILSYPTHKEASRYLAKTQVIEFESGYSFCFRDLAIDPFPITHDACDPVGFVIESSDGAMGVATDLGIATRLVVDKLQKCRIVIVESNHDEDMLMNGPYPWHLKQRIRSRHGHLSNNDSAALLEEILHPCLEGVFLAHLSEVNNDPSLAHSAATIMLASTNICSPKLIVGTQDQVSEIFCING